jgi:hypothetical protein
MSTVGLDGSGMAVPGLPCERGRRGDRGRGRDRSARSTEDRPPVPRGGGCRLGVSLTLADVLARRAEGVPGVHITAAADELLARLAATEADALSDGSGLMALARTGALVMVSAAETAG